MLDEAEQDRLAQEFLWQDAVRYAHPLGWIGDTFVELDAEAASRRRASRPRKVDVDPNTPVTRERHIWPPLRSWSAARILTRRHAEPTDVLQRARMLSPRDGAAVVAGSVHAANELDAGAASEIVEIALRWAHKTPRLTALKHLVEDGEMDRARALAADDPDASIRAWGLRMHVHSVDNPSLFD